MRFGWLAILVTIGCLAGREPFPATLAYVTGLPGSSAPDSSDRDRFPSKNSETPAPLQEEKAAERLADCAVEASGDFVLPLTDFKPLASPAFPDSGPYHPPTSKGLLYSIGHLLI